MESGETSISVPNHCLNDVVLVYLPTPSTRDATYHSKLCISPMNCSRSSTSPADQRPLSPSNRTTEVEMILTGSKRFGKTEWRIWILCDCIVASLVVIIDCDMHGHQHGFFFALFAIFGDNKKPIRRSPPKPQPLQTPPPPVLLNQPHRPPPPQVPKKSRTKPSISPPPPPPQVPKKSRTKPSIPPPPVLHNLPHGPPPPQVPKKSRTKPHSPPPPGRKKSRTKPSIPPPPPPHTIPTPVTQICLAIAEI